MPSYGSIGKNYENAQYPPQILVAKQTLASALVIMTFTRSITVLNTAFRDNLFQRNATRSFKVLGQTIWSYPNNSLMGEQPLMPP